MSREPYIVDRGDDDLVLGSALPNDIRESIAIAGVNATAGQSAALANATFANEIANVARSQQNTAANQQAVNQLAQVVTGKAVNAVANLSVLESVATLRLNQGNDVAEQISDLKAALASARRRPPGPLPPVPPLPPRLVTPSFRKRAQGGTAVYLRKRDLPAKIEVVDSTNLDVN